MALRLIGLTGGIGAGKSEALAAFARLGAETFSTDAAVHELLSTEEMRDLLVQRWGEQMLDQEGGLDRAAIASVVFADPGELEWLESELHPRVGERIQAWRESLSTDAGLAVVEVPLLFESGMDRFFDATVAIVADEETRRRRAEARGHAGLEGRTGRQLTQEEKAQRATHAVVNDGTVEDLERKLSELVAEFTGGAGSTS